MNNNIGKRYGNLVIIGEQENINGRKREKCLCDCGKTIYVDMYKLKNGYTKSCGCKKTKYKIINRRIFNCWWGMKQRCDSSSRKDSKYYHDKGITYCEDWETYENFQEWALNNGYSDNLTLDRINGSLPYCPENCRWITIEEQQRNRSNCLYFTYKGETKTLSEWSRFFGINRTTLHDRIFKFGYSFEEAIKKPLRSMKTNVYIDYKGTNYTQAQFARLLNCSPQYISKLRKMGYSPEQIKEKVTETTP